MYEEAAPPGALAGVARCVWRSASAGPKRIVPDGCLDLVVGDGAVFIAGPDTAAWSSVTRPRAELRGVRFTPGRAPAVLGVAADELRDRRVPLGEVWGRAGEELAERLLSGELTPAQAVASRLPEVPPADPAVAALIARLDAGAARVAEAAAMVTGAARTAAALDRSGADPASLTTQSAGPARAAALLARPGAPRAAPELTAARLEDPGPFAVSERRLRRRFVQAVGYGPATYLRVSRFQRAVALAPRTPGLAALAAAAGYADQAHLSRDCRALTGLTPRAYFRPPSTVDEAVRDRLRSA
ncbi:helix-turn-helix domain-containing protein [Amycolatopsis mongoliensis]|uniref:Helix-turn-helix domain-containing protein n=1 Tax=Amycolatopsis mongoliensis TaxID=715475 RepID=A0A9Y2NDB8_9PSEU|nr:helix-turn-helix domain-containing protein [Amycolatopsis sp. 4-36]WIY01561.1 helix-turn-helix domain-containing protein [Amycolatopsis sp. 4-36]